MCRKSSLLVLFLLVTGCTTAISPLAAPPAPSKSPSATASAAPTPSASAPTSTPKPKPTPSQAPTGARARDHNPLNRLTKAKPMACDAPRVRDRDFRSMKSYLTAVTKCLDRFWAREFARAGLRFTKPGRAVLRTKPKKFCGDKWMKGADGVYCFKPGNRDHRRLVLVIGSDWLWNDTRISMAILTAHEYGHHIQEMSGYRTVADDAYWIADGQGRKAEDLVTRRSELQTDCFAGIAVGALYDSLFSSRWHWDEYRRANIDWNQPDAWDRHHGLPKTKVKWTERGFKARTTGACNTWRHKASEVK